MGVVDTLGHGICHWSLDSAELEQTKKLAFVVCSNSALSNDQWHILYHLANSWNSGLKIGFRISV